MRTGAAAASRSGCSRTPPGQAREAGLYRLALDTGVQNAPARALYAASGFVQREVRHAPDDRAARALGGPGFVAYLKAL